MESPIVRSEPLAQQVYRFLKEQILSGMLQPGDRVVETRIASDLNISRSPVREALRLLLAEHLISDVDGSLQVFNPSVQDFQELYELRLALESEASRWAATRVTPEILELLAKNLLETKECVESGEWDLLVSLNSRFHVLVLQAANNTRFAATMEMVSALIDYYCYLILEINQKQTNIVAEHTVIYDALCARDKEAAYHAMYTHIHRDLEVIGRKSNQRAVVPEPSRS